MTKVTPEIPMRLADESSYDVDPGKGWVLFAGVMLVVVGALNLVAGIAAVDDSRFFVRDVEIVVTNLQTLGWVLIVLGALQLLTGIGVFLESELARWGGIGFASLNLVAQFILLPAHPGWTMIIFFVDIIIIFGLVTYGGRDRHSLRG
jgi:hypothetical protein